MTDIDGLVRQMFDEGAQLWADNGKIRFKAPNGVVTGERIAAMRDHKPQVIALLDRLGLVSQAASEGQLIAHGRARAPLTAAQQRLWLADQLGHAGPAYNMPASVRLEGPLDAGALQRALQAVVHRHESLRTRFIDDGEGDGPQQHIDPPAPWRLPVVDLSMFAAARRVDEARRLCTETATCRFDFQRGPLLRASLLRLEPELHVLAVCVHHIVSDGWSLAVLVNELMAGYRAFTRGESPPPKPLAAQYADFALWQQARQGAPLMREHAAHWQECLFEAPPTTTLPMDFAPPTAANHAGADVIFEWPIRVAQALRGVAREEGTTLFTVVLAAFNVLLYRWSGQTDLVVGTPVAGRPLRQTEEMIGLFVNMLPLRTRIDPDQSFRDLVRSTAESTLNAYMHQDLPFERMLELAGAEHSPTRHPLFQIALSLENMPRTALQLPGLQVREERLPTDTSRFDLTLFLRESAAGLSGYAEYATALFQRSTIENFLVSFEVLLGSLGTTPDAPVGRAALLSAPERTRILTQWNRTAVDYPRDLCVHELFERQAALTPAAVALVFDDRSMSYADLNARANRLAHRLRQLGVQPGVLVGLCLERSFDLVVAIFATIKAGGAYVPLEPSHPDDRIARLLADARPGVVLTCQALASRVASATGAVLCLDGSWQNAAGLLPTDLPPLASPGDVVYVIYTSGSTGQPKGVANLHTAIVNRLVWMQSAYRLDADDCVAQKTPCGFDVSVWEFFWPLMCGARLVIARPEGHKDPAYLAQLFARHAVTTVHFVPSMLEAFLDEPTATDALALRRVICSGEALPAKLRDRFFGLFPIELHNLYGPTEAAVDVTFHRCARSEGAVVPIGRPIANTRIHILDRHLEPVPVGVAGELHIGGVGLARGYLGQPRLTAERFIDDPFRPEEGARLYKSGDLARYAADGSIEYLGRLDHQVKIRGVRVELGEIEACLLEDERVAQAIAMTHGSGSEQRLVAYCVATATASPWAGGHRRHGLPNGMAIACQSSALAHYLYREIFDDDIYLRHGVELQPGACVFDVGANIGMFALMVSARFPGSSVYAFEPIPPTCEMLTLNAGLYGPGVKPMRFGLSSHAHRCEFIHYPQAPLMSGRYANADADARTAATFMMNSSEPDAVAASPSGAAADLLAATLGEEVHVCQLRTVSELIDEYDIATVDLLKIDVERSEWDVLMGVAPAHWPRIRQVVVEVHDISGRLDSVVELLKGHGLECTVEQQGDLVGTELHNVYAVRPGNPRANVGSTALGAATLVPPERLAPLSENGVRERLMTKLPAAMVPTQIVILEALPLSANGKVDRRALAASAKPHDAPARMPSGPASATEHSVAGIFCELLRLERVGRDDSFFDLGGHSLLALKLLGRINRRFGVEVSVAELFASPCVAGVAAAIDGPETDARSGGLVCLRGSPAGTPLFLLHAAGGHLLDYRTLVAGMSHTGPIYGLQRPELRSAEPPRLLRLEQLAAAYADEMRRLHPEGPYLVAGWSFGGILAIVVAQVLRAAGADVRYVGAIDAMLVARAPAANGLAWPAHWAGEPVGTTLQTASKPLQDAAEAMLHSHGEVGSPLQRSAQAPAASDSMREMLLANLWALAVYEPTAPLPPVHFYSATQSAGVAGYAESLETIGTLSAAAIELRTLDGDHRSVLRGTAAEALARQIESDLRSVA